MEDTSLDQFLDRGDEGSPDDTSGTDDGAAPSDDAPGGDEPVGDDTETADADPAATIYRFDPDGARCADCGERVPARWRDDQRFVCRSCKSW